KLSPWLPSFSFVNDLRVSCLGSLLNRPLSYFDRQSSSPSSCALLLSQQPPIALSLIDHKLSSVVDGFVACFGVIILTFIVCLPSGIVGVSYLGLYLILLLIFEKINNKAYQEVVEVDKSGELAMEIFDNVATIQQLAVERHFQSKFNDILEKRDVPLAKKIRCQSIVHSTNRSIFLLFNFIATTVGVYFVYLGHYTTKELFTTESLVADIGFATYMMSFSFKDMVSASSAAKLLFGLINPMREGKEEKEIKLNTRGNLKSEKITFAYPSQPNRNVLSEVSFGVGQGIADNIRLGTEGISDEDVRRACEFANANEFITDFPEGYSTLVGEKGRSLSGGQKQRIAIARALVRNPKVIILDEATSALDTQSEKIVRVALESSTKGRTSVMIAHRLDTIKHCDEIYFVEGGRIVERGNHYELMKRRGKMERSSSSTLLLEDDNRRNRRGFFRRIITFFDEDESDDFDDIQPFSFLQLFRFASKKERFIIIIASLFSFIAGFITPIHMFVVGRVTTIYVEEKSPINNEIFLWSVWRWSSLYGIGFCVGIVIEYTQHYLHMWATERMMQRCRRKFISAVLTRNSLDFDISTGELSNRLNSHIDRMRDGVGDKLGICISTFIVSSTISFILDWQTTLLMVWAGPIYVLSSTLIPKLSEKATKRGLSISEEANGISEESILNVKTVASCNGQKQMIEIYSSILSSGVKSAVKVAASSGLLEAISYFVYNFSNCAGLWFATVSYHNGRVSTAGNVFSVVYLSLISANRFSRIGPQLITVFKARTAAAKVYEIIDSVEETSESLLDPSTQLNIEFKNVSFSYPSRSLPALLNLSFLLPSGKSLALVGKSGCGKSTTVKLLTKFLKCQTPSILIDGVSINEYDTKKWRQMMGIVSQEPCLFNGSIRENICLGRPFNDIQIIEACKIAHAHEFIGRLDKGYDTLLGPSGVSLSGGQKQRIAIARAIVSNPRILILDEATSALDTKSERIVQEALDSASEGRSTIVIAHRLSTIRNIDQVIVMENGEVIESGNYDELRWKENGIFARMIKDQEIEKGEEIISSSESEDSFEAIEEEEYASIKGGFFALVKRHKFKVFIVFLMGILKGIATPLLSVRYFFVIGSLEDENYENLLFWLVTGTMTVAVYQAFLLLISPPICQYMGETIMNEMRVSVLHSLLHRSMSYFDRKESSPAASSVLLSQQPQMTMALVDHKLSIVVDGLFACIAILVLTFAICFPNGFVGVIYLITYLFLLILFEKMYDGANKKLVELDTSGELAVEIFDNIGTIQQLAVEHHFQKKYDEIQKKREIPLAKKVKWQSLIHGTNESIFMLFDCIATSVGVYFVFTGDYSTKQLFTTECLVSVVGWLTGLMSFSFKEIITASSAVKLLFGIIDPSMEKRKMEKELDHIAEGSLRGQSISFAYPSQPNRRALIDVSFNVGKGRSLALVGPSGGGKSTIVNLLERFYDPDYGMLMLDSTPFTSLSHHQLRSNISLVGQEPILFRGSISDNIRLGKENASDEEVKEACRLANAIQDLPEGYSTLVGEKGRSLSGGQKQRIAIARALVRNPKVIILDEATSALDTQSEKVVRVALESSSYGRTSIMIAHRLDTITQCDEICFIEGGKILERGSHSELIAKRGKYYEMTEQQRMF
ncbi:hypothetical protein PRIPAC_75234, partial [Pristionchus pacificus]|uniref:AAA protein n=1 Tax=Pristionchus pacificus TaxID=54126 RepID=A0A2A6C0I1_PRIPA